MNRRPFHSRGAALAALVASAATALTPEAARAKSIAYEEEEPVAPMVTAAPVSSTSLAGSYGMPAIIAALKSGDASARAAAVERAAEVAGSTKEEATRDSAWALVESATNATLDDDPDGALSVRIAAARALSKSPRPEALKALDPLMRNPEPPVRSTTYSPPTWGGYPGPYGPFPPYPSPYPYPPYGPAPTPQYKVGKRASIELVRYVRDTAAMALAARGNHAELLKMLRTEKEPENLRAIFQALSAYPAPQSPLDAVSKSDKLSFEEVITLDRLGDARAADRLLATAVGGGAPGSSSQSAAIRALAHLGDARVIPLITGLPSNNETGVRIAAAEALAILGDSSAEAAILALVTDAKADPKGEKAIAEASRLALEHPSPGLVAMITPIAAQGNPLAIAALGRIGAPAIPKLLAFARDDTSPARDGAAYALAMIPSADLSAIAEGSPARRRRAVRAAAVRAARIGSSSLESDGKALSTGTDPADRAAGTLLLSVLDLGRARSALGSKDLPTKKAAATALLAHPRAKAAEVARDHLAAHGSTEDPEVLRALAGVAARAVDGTIAHDVPISTAILSGWLAEDSAVSPIAAFILAARGGAFVEAQIARALAASSYDVRAGALLGLGMSPDAGASSLLAKQILAISRPALRRAAMRALAARGSSALLASIRRLEPDAEARAIAASAKTPRSSLLSGDEVVELRIDGAASPLATATLADGLTLPIAVDPEGFVFVFRAPAGPSRIGAEAKAKGP